jgi:hypothetical protein
VAHYHLWEFCLGTRDVGFMFLEVMASPTFSPHRYFWYTSEKLLLRVNVTGPGGGERKSTRRSKSINEHICEE